ncbi:8-oxo-dGTP diphosphatase MutT [Vibrio mimicus]|uniref:8-oxo-dGTP diphosphatase MutT n=1 Tax=Vibrio mimicus TaxID=674 RepID=UPI00076B7FA2|nr:8-oxo-dGTP diphosphatase MutT [Vibrio mimicus]AMG02761.1 8-oxo-dGTP diphosphatase MutT [Vibrio mimicus]KAA3492667.1 8-oxo-dGTP diphosphatase MutT [Vibrio mimicus]
MKRIHIVAGIIFNPDQSEIFITKRPDHLHKGGFWEFPGGKVEAGESIEQAMARELDEEVGIVVTEQQPFQHFDYDYTDKSLSFDFMLVTAFENQPHGCEGQQGCWVKIADLANYRFPEANEPVLQQVIAQFGYTLPT